MTPHKTKKIRHCLASLGLILGLLLSWALPATEPVAPFGFAIGQATRQAVTNGLKGRTKLTPTALTVTPTVRC